MGAAARALFDKQPSGLDENESLILAVLLRGPNAAPEMVAKRACAVAESFEPPRGCAGVAALATRSLAGVPNLRPAAALAPHVAHQLVTAQARRVTSTLDGALQAFALDAVQAPARPARRAACRRCRGAGGSTTPAARCWPTSATRGAESSARYVDGVQAARQAGSTLKPFLYELAIEERAVDRGLAAGRLAGQHRHARRAVRPAELRPRLQGHGEPAHGAVELAQRAGGAHADAAGHRPVRRALARARLRLRHAGRRVLRLLAGAGLGRDQPVAARQRLSDAGAGRRGVASSPGARRAGAGHARRRTAPPASS